MLYDPRWGKPEVKAEPITLPHLVAWLETKEPSERYCYDDTGRCLLGQYLKACGVAEYSLGNVTLWLIEHDDTIDLRKNGFMATAMPSPHTFGAALTRARKVLANQR